MADIEEILTRGVVNIIPGRKELEEKLKKGKLNIYFGIDPTSTKIHLGHTVALRKINKLAKLGHKVVFLIGDFTALIGDTSDKETERPALTEQEIKENFKTYRKQAEKVIDFSKIEIKYNSTWLKNLGFAEVIKFTQYFSAGDFVSRELIRKRLLEGKRVGLHEFLYPVMQGYDSYFMDTDLQVGGTDQTFNMQAGRTLQKILRNKESFVLSTPILEGPDGHKMSKSWGNAIWLDDTPEEMFGKIMSIGDNLIISYFTLCTNLSVSEIEKIKTRMQNGENPINIKKELAKTIVSQFHSEKEGQSALLNFEKTVQKKEKPDEISKAGNYKPGILLSVIAIKENLVASNSNWKRLVGQGGVKLNNEAISDNNAILGSETQILQVGKRKYLKIEPEL